MADVDRSTTRRANPVVVADRAGREADIRLVAENDGTTTEALATFEAGRLPVANQDLYRQMVESQRLILIELRLLTLLVSEQHPSGDSLDVLREDIARELH